MSPSSSSSSLEDGGARWRGGGWGGGGGGGGNIGCGFCGGGSDGARCGSGGFDMGARGGVGADADTGWAVAGAACGLCHRARARRARAPRSVLLALSAPLSALAAALASDVATPRSAELPVPARAGCVAGTAAGDEEPSAAGGTRRAWRSDMTRSATAADDGRAPCRVRPVRLAAGAAGAGARDARAAVEREASREAAALSSSLGCGDMSESAATEMLVGAAPLSPATDTDPVEASTAGVARVAMVRVRRARVERRAGGDERPGAAEVTGEAVAPLRVVMGGGDTVGAVAERVGTVAGGESVSGSMATRGSAVGPPDGVAVAAAAPAVAGV